MPPAHHRSGFSLIEALVVLAVGGMALTIIFSIGSKAGDTGFALGRRALTVADTDMAMSDLRSVLRSLSLTPARTFAADLDIPIEGEPSRLTAPMVMERATQCAPQGWAGSVTLTLEPAGDGVTVFCTLSGRKVPLLTIARSTATFSYSLDGQTWSPRYSSLPTQNERTSDLQSRSLFVRMQASSIHVVERVTSGQPAPWARAEEYF